MSALSLPWLVKQNDAMWSIVLAQKALIVGSLDCKPSWTV